MYVCMYVCLSVCLSDCMHACMYVCMHVCVYVCVYVCMYVCIYVCIYACVYACICECMHACMYVLFAQVVICWRSWVLLQHFACPTSAKRFLRFRASRSNAKQVYVGALFQFFFVSVGSCWRFWALCRLILSLLGPILSSSWSKMVLRWLNIAQHSAKMSQDSLQEQLQNFKKPSKVMYCRCFFDFRNF